MAEQATKKPEETIPFTRGDLFTQKDGLSYLLGSRCPRCGRIYFPKRTLCYDCKTLDPLSEVLLPRRGNIDQGAIVNIAPLGFQSPYVVGYVILPGGIRLFTQLVKDNLVEDDLKHGNEVEVEIGKIRVDQRGADVIGFKFRIL